MPTEKADTPIGNSRTAEEKEVVINAFVTVFNSPQGRIVLNELDRIMEAEDTALTAVSDPTVYAFHTAGRRSLLRDIKKAATKRGPRHG